MNPSQYYRNGAKRHRDKRREAAQLVGTDREPDALLTEAGTVDSKGRSVPPSEVIRHKPQARSAPPEGAGIYYIEDGQAQQGPMTREQVREKVTDAWRRGVEPKVWWDGIGKDWLPVEEIDGKTRADHTPEPEPTPEGETTEEEDEAQPEGEEEAPEATGDVIGYWMIPYEGSFLKVKILEQYYASRPFKPFGFSMPTFGKDDEGAMRLGKKQPASLQPGGKWAPIWPILVHLDKLKEHFKWLEPRESNADALYDVDAEHHHEAAMIYQKKLMSHGWYWLILEGSNAYLGGEDGYPDFFPALISELRGGPANSPRNVTVNGADIERFKFVSPRGTTVETVPMAEINRRFPQGGGAAAGAGAKGAQPREDGTHEFTDRTDAIVQLHNGSDEGGVDMENVSEKQLADIFNKKELDALYKKVPDALKNVIKRLLTKYISHATQQGWKTSYSESLDEESYRRLYRLTAQNGQYAIGGMRRIGGVWVVDPNVPGRMENARFVITRAPRIFMGNDGLFQMRYRFQSRTDRNTTGVAQSGWVKFLPPSKGLLKRVLRWAKHLFVAETAWDSDVHVFCTCPDFKYRWHWVLANAGAAHEPTGAGEATNTPPDQTNPGRLLCLCKHLVAVGPFIQNPPKEFTDRIDQLSQNREEEPALVPQGPDQTPEVAVDAELEDEETQATVD